MLEATSKGSVQTWTIKDQGLGVGYYKVSKIEDNSGKTFNHTQITGYCQCECGIKSNVDQKVLIDKEDDDKQQFMLKLIGNCNHDTAAELSPMAFGNGKTVKLSSICFLTDSNSTLYCELNDIIRSQLEGGEDRDKAISYALQFISKECNEEVITTKITIDVVAGNYISLNRYSLLLSLLIFFFFL